MGLEKDRQGCLHLIDFGLAKRYLEKDGSHIKIGMFCSYKFLTFFINLICFKCYSFELCESSALIFWLANFQRKKFEFFYLDPEARSPIGTKRYMSRNVLMGETPSRRDDIISCLYILCYFRSGGKLPWCQLDKKYPQKNPREIREIAIHKRRIDGKF